MEPLPECVACDGRMRLTDITEPVSDHRVDHGQAATLGIQTAIWTCQNTHCDGELLDVSEADR